MTPEDGRLGRKGRTAARAGAVRSELGEAGVTLIELLVAIVILAVGLLAVAGMTGAVATQTRMGGSVTGQTTAAQEVLEDVQVMDFADVQSNTRRVTVGSYTYTVDYQVNNLRTNLKEVVAVVEGTRELPADTFRTLVAQMDPPPPIP